MPIGSTASRWWRGNEPEWDVVAESLDRTKLLIGEVKLRASQHDVENLLRRPDPSSPGAGASSRHCSSRNRAAASVRLAPPGRPARSVYPKAK